MKTSRILIMAGIIGYGFSISSCNKETEEKVETRPVAIQFTGDIAGLSQSIQESKTTGEEWSNQDAIGIFMVEHKGTDILENTINKKYTTTGSGAFTAASGQDIFYPENSTKVDFIAYYPYEEQLADLGSVSVDVSGQQTAAVQSSLDLLWCRTDNNGVGYDKESSGNRTVAMEFTHRLSKLLINCKAGTGLQDALLEGMDVKIIGMNTRSNLDLATGLLGIAETVATILPNEITAATGFAASYDAIILPESYNAGTVTVDFVINGETFVWTLEAERFESGWEYEYEVTINRTDIKVISTIRPWKNENRGSVVAE